jgi:hypothetical protein
MPVALTAILLAYATAAHFAPGVATTSESTRLGAIDELFLRGVHL